METAADNNQTILLDVSKVDYGDQIPNTIRTVFCILAKLCANVDEGYCFFSNVMRKTFF